MGLTKNSPNSKKRIPSSPDQHSLILKCLPLLHQPMAFDEFNKHCLECKIGQSCGKPHVYAIELRKEILEKKWFRKRNEDYQEGMLCLYVGQTSHLAKCRASIHQHWVKGPWENRKGLTYHCYCEGEMVKKAFTKKTGSSPKVHEFNTALLRGNLFRKFNPIQDGEDREDEEEKLALHLRQQGYAVWAGHHDGKLKNQ